MASQEEEPALGYGLGDLGCLPFEVRAKIWQHACHYAGYRRDTNLLTVSRQIGKEVVDAVNHGRFLHFLIRPNHTTVINHKDVDDRASQLWPSRFYVVDNRFIWPIVHPRWLHFDVFDNVSWFDRMARHSLSSDTRVRVAIRPPLRGNDGHFLMAWNKVLWTTRFLATAPTLASLTVEFVGTVEEWLHARSPQQSYQKCFLIPFQRLRRVRRFVVILPQQSSPRTDRMDVMIQAIRSYVTKDRSFDPGRCSTDRLVLQKEEAFCSVCDDLLDDMSGKAAALLRLERMASLHKGYSRVAMQRGRSVVHFNQSETIQNLSRMLDDRLNAMYTWCAGSYAMGPSMAEVRNIRLSRGLQLERSQHSDAEVQARQKMEALESELERTRGQVRALERRTHEIGRLGKPSLIPRDEDLGSCPAYMR